MNKRIIVFAIFFLSFLGLRGQKYNEGLETTFINDFVTKVFPDKRKKICLETGVYSNYVLSVLDRKEASAELYNYIYPNNIDTIIYEINKLGQDFFWKDIQNKSLRLISDTEAKQIIDLASVPVMMRIRGNIFRRSRMVTVRTVDTSNVIIKTSVPYFLKNNYCIMYYTVSYTESRGYSCFCLYHKGEDQIWREEKCILCKVS
ncbi:MAG: hypothetical protein WC716_15900 [Chitinophagaceae bacterium]